MTHGSLFSGIGGFDYAAQLMGWENVFHCEWNESGQRVLKYYWPNAISYHDITKTDFTIHRGRIDVLTGGFPCQPYSTAGKRLGKDDDRHLWPEMLRAIREIQPTWVVGENVRGLVNWNGGLVFHEVQADLEAAGYEVLPFLLPACAVNAPHRRDRIWFVAYRPSSRPKERQQDNGRENSSENKAGLDNRPKRHGNKWPTPHPSSDRRKREGSESEAEKRLQSKSERTGELEGGFEGLGVSGNAADTDSGERCEGRMYQAEQQKAERHVGSCDTWSSGGAWQNFPTQSPVRYGDDGLSSKLDGITFSKWRNESIKAGGNAVVPQVVLQIFKAIEQYNNIRP